MSEELEDIFDVQTHRDGDYYIIYSRRLFSDGYNVYKRESETQARKLNPMLHFFITEEAAKQFIEEDKQKISASGGSG